MPLINLCICILSVVKIERYTQSIRYPLHFLVLVKSCYQLIFILGDYKENNNLSAIIIQYLLTFFFKYLSRTHFGNFDDAKRKHTLTKIFLNLNDTKCYKTLINHIVAFCQSFCHLLHFWMHFCIINFIVFKEYDIYDFFICTVKFCLDLHY